MALLVDDRALLVHHIIVFQQAFADTEVVLFFLLLGAFDAVVYHLGLDHLAILEAELVHNAGNAIVGEETH